MSSRTRARFTALPDARAVASAAADRVVDAARDAIAEQGVFRIALSGGSTPRLVYPLLTAAPRRDAVDWRRVEFFWGDERAVPPDHPESNFGLAYQLLIAQLPDVRPQHIHRMAGEAADLDAAALAYEGELRLAFDARGVQPPPFDLIWLGMGADGHTASLFPGSDALGETERWVVATRVARLGTSRLTLTLPMLNAARRVLFVAVGGDKAPALADIRAGGSDLPAARVDAASVEWLVDAAAAGDAQAE